MPHEVNAASSAIAEAAHEDANIIFGLVIDEAFTDQVKITVIATGFEHARQAKQKTGAAAARESSSAQGTPWALSSPPVRPDDRGIPEFIFASDGTPRSRRCAASTLAPAPSRPAEVAPLVDFDGTLDIPTFLRRQADRGTSSQGETGFGRCSRRSRLGVLQTSARGTVTPSRRPFVFLIFCARILAVAGLYR